MDSRKKQTGFVECVFFISVAVKKNAWRQRPFVHLVLLKLTVPGLWRLYFGVISRQISFPEHFLELQLTILAWKLYASCACCVNIKFSVHVYSVFVWISLDSLVAVAVSVCRFSFASAGADLGGGCRGCAPPWDDLRFSNTTGILQEKKKKNLCGLLVLK